MKIMILTDLEAVAGVINFDDWCVPGGRFYEKGMRLLTQEVNAAVDGFAQGGATEIIVIDGHGRGAMDPELLDERAWLIRGHYEQVWPYGLDDSYDGLAFVGQHAKAGTPYSHLTHTQSLDHIDMTINGVSIGEYGQLALCAMEVGVPTFFAAGEEALASEAAQLTPGVVTVAVKRGLLPDGLDHLDTDAYRQAKLSAIHVSPKRARAMIREKALVAIKKLREGPQSFGYPKLKPPYVRTVKLRRNRDAPPRSASDEHPDSIIALMNMPYSIQEQIE